MWQNVLIVHGQPVLRQGLRRLLADRHDVRVAGEASDERTALELVASLRPSVVLLESMMPGPGGASLTRALAEALSGVRIIAFGEADSAQGVNLQIDAGALGYLTPDADAAELSRAIDAVLAGQIHVSSRLANMMAPAPASPDETAAILTDRQREVLALMADGRSTREIAELLGLSAKTVETHRKHIMDRLGIHTVAELTKYAIRVGLTTL